MTVYCRIEKGHVVNRAVFEGEIPADWPDCEHWIASEEAQIGWSYRAGVFKAPPSEPVQEVERSVGDVKVEAGRRLASTDWLVLRALERGEPVPADLAAQREAIRKRSGEIEKFKRIPRDLSDDKLWGGV